MHVQGGRALVVPGKGLFPAVSTNLDKELTPGCSLGLVDRTDVVGQIVGIED